jgi:hypothetical protein
MSQFDLPHHSKEREIVVRKLPPHIFQQLSFEQHGSGVFLIHAGFCNIITQNVNL